MSQEIQHKPEKLSTYGKAAQQLIRLIWPEAQIDLKDGPEAFLSHITRMVAPPEMIAEFAKLPALIGEYIARQVRMEAMLFELTQAFEDIKARKESHGNDNSNDRDNRSITGPVC